MVSTRHHPREFPEPELSPSQSPTSTKSSLKASSPNGSSRSPSKLTPTRKLTFEMSTSSPLPFAEPLTPRPGLHNPPPLLILWLVVSLPLVIWDTLYVFLRPHSMEGGIFHSPIWTPYKLYATVDYTYGWPAWDGGVGFTAAQASLNALETAGYVWYFWRVARGLQGVGKEGGGTGGRFAALLKGTHGGSRECAGAVTVGFATSVMTVSKTILYCKSLFPFLFHSRLGVF